MSFIGFFCIWPVLYISINSFYNNAKISRNLVSGCHSISSIILYINKFSYLNIFSFSSSYFFFDICYIIYKNIFFNELIYIIHHIFGILLINTNIFTITDRILVFESAELSNAFTYIVYHKLKTNSSSYLKILKQLQFMWYFIFRVCVFSYFFYSRFFVYGKFIFITSPIYLFGIICTYGQYIRL